jgi:hypothetical protein
VTLPPTTAHALAIRHGATWRWCPAARPRWRSSLRAQASPAIAALHEHPWHRREFGSHLTNVVRALALEARGYKVTVTELAGWEHSLKNELILGRKIRARDQAAQARLDELLAVTGVRPKIVRLLGEQVEPEPEAV